MKISFITTIYNEEKTIERFLDSLLTQSKLPNEVIIVDGNSRDQTVEKIKEFESKIKRKKIRFTLLVKKGNRSVGRNAAIQKATGDIIVCSDAGNILNNHWIKNITKQFVNPKVDVVAGYYDAKPKNIFQKCLLPYVFVMPDQVNPQEFLPATRSIAFTKKIWEKVGGFDEAFSHNEDYVFANRLKEIGAKIVFAKDAIVYWVPRDTFGQAFYMFYRFAMGDAEAKILRSKVLLVFARYFFGLYFILLCLLYQSLLGVIILFAALILYCLWAAKKNYRYVHNTKAIYILPLLQFTADVAILVGTSVGMMNRLQEFHLTSYIKKHTFLVCVLAIYSGVMLSFLQWGIPNRDHPFPYHMDEWHQLQAVGNTFRYGTPNTEGSANGTMFHFLLSGFYLIPFMTLQIVDPFSLQIDNIFMRQRVFEVLRIQTILFGVLSLITLYKIATMIDASKRVVLFLFTVTPLWLLLSGYFKYDIALMFWILLSLFFFLRFAKTPNNRNFIVAAIPVSIAIAVKISALPLLPIYIFVYFWFHVKPKRNIKYLFGGVGVSLFCLLFFGFPDTLFGKGNILYYLYDNIVHSPSIYSQYQLGVNPFVYLFFTHNSLVFGHGVFFLFIGSVLFFLLLVLKTGIKKSQKMYRVELFILFSLLMFIASLLPLQLAAVGNRSLVILPFIVLFIGVMIKNLQRNYYVRLGLFVVIGFTIIVQLFESFAWISIKIADSPQHLSSLWVQKNIPKGQTIGVENIPIYQYLPNIIQKEYYFKEYKVPQKNLYRYEVIDSHSNRLPSFIVITNGAIEKKLLKDSPKKRLLQRIEQEGYRKTISFSPDFTYYNFVGNFVDYYLPGIVTAPTEISIYKK